MKKIIAIAAAVAVLIGAAYCYLGMREAAAYEAWGESLPAAPAQGSCEDPLVAGVTQANPGCRMLLSTDRQQLEKLYGIGRVDPDLTQFRHVLLYSPQALSFPERVFPHLRSHVTRGDTFYCYAGATLEDNEVTSTECKHMNELLGCLGMKKIHAANFERVREFSYDAPDAGYDYRINEYRMKGGFYLIEISIRPKNLSFTR